MRVDGCRNTNDVVSQEFLSMIPSTYSIIIGIDLPTAFGSYQVIGTENRLDKFIKRATALGVNDGGGGGNQPRASARD